MLKILRNTLIILLTLVLVVICVSQIMYLTLSVDPPHVDQVSNTDEVIVENGIRKLNGSWYHQNDQGLWEAYLQGEPLKRGSDFGKLAIQQIQDQEDHFIAQIRRLIPSEWFLNTLKYGVAWFNRNLPVHISEEMQLELFGVSQSFDPDYEFIGSNYSRILNYHAAHDIGHALQDLSIVGCTSFAAWDENTADSSLIIARNFDFYMGDDFSKDKIILFMKPDSGYAFASITWAGFMGVVSGMNEHGLTVTLNAAKSSVPQGSKTPISVLAREILQYARTIDQAYEIAASRQTFVSESILIGSAADGKAAIIEKSPNALDIFFSNENRMVCSNHYQSDGFLNTEVNQLNIKNGDSDYRYKRMNQLVKEQDTVSVVSAAAILRDQNGIDNVDLGMGNPKALNQLLAHHGIIFQPEKRLIWISTNPFQLGKFLCYDLNEVFSLESSSPNLNGIYVDSLTIPADAFLTTNKYKDFLRYKDLKNRLFEFVALGRGIEWNEELDEEFINSNPESYITYSMLGDYYLESGNLERAEELYSISLSKEVASVQERNHINKNLESCR